ncbi:MAG: hypothetical protein DRQ55_12600 [Planctomycetota bacterium]|nr:MAG: hypothetical protein DRQ55_12600 [Planctomycetota bacterium]
MTESHAPERWPVDPARITHPQIIRHLQACAPCAASLHETLLDPRPGARLARKERSGPALIENVLARALSDGDGQAAVLLYEMARASLRQIKPYASEIEWTEMPAPFMDLRADVCTLSKRLTDGEGKLDGLPAATPTVDASANTADRCLDLAERFAPGWKWVEFERAHVLLVRDDCEAAADVLGRVEAGTDEPRLRYWALRNAAHLALRSQDWRQALHIAGSIQESHRDDMAPLILHVESHTRLGAAQAASQAILALTDAVSTWTPTDAEQWGAYLVTRLTALGDTNPLARTQLARLADLLGRQRS